MLSVATVNHCYTQQVVFDKETNKLKPTGGCQTVLGICTLSGVIVQICLKSGSKKTPCPGFEGQSTLIGGTSPYGAYMALSSGRGGGRQKLIIG